MEREGYRSRLLIADDEPLYLETTSQLLKKAGFECVCVSDAESAIAVLREQPIDLLLTDLNMPGNLKLELLRSGRSEWPHLPVVVVTGVPSLPTAIEGVRLGIADYLIKPVRFDVLLQSVRRILESKSSQPAGVPPGSNRETSAARAREIDERTRELIGRSPAMTQTLGLIDRMAESDANVLISGESGTGKELAARAIHWGSRRCTGPFQVIDCTAIPEALFESLLFGHAKGSFTGANQEQTGLLAKSDGGTAFFDEIGELPLTLQPKLLRVIQEQTFVPVGKTAPTTLHTRFVCATNRNLLAEVEAGRFRQDLFYRLSVLHLELPPLRDRGDDVIELARRFLKGFTEPGRRIVGFTDACLERLRAHPWPGNVRELRNAIESAVALCRGSLLDVSDLPPWVIEPESSSGDPNSVIVSGEPRLDISREQVLDRTDRRYLETLIATCNGNVSRAARTAGLSRQTLHKHLKRHAISPSKFRRGS